MELKQAHKFQFYSQLCSVALCWQFEISNGRSIYTTKMKKGYKSENVFLVFKRASVLIQHWLKPDGIISQTSSQGNIQSTIMRKWKSLAHRTSDAAPNPQKSYNSLFKNSQRERSSGILKNVVYNHGPMTVENGKIQNKQSLKLWLEGKKIRWSQRQGKKELPTLYHSKKNRTEKSHTTMKIILSKHTRTKTMKETIKTKQKRTQLRNKKTFGNNPEQTGISLRWY